MGFSMDRLRRAYFASDDCRRLEMLRYVEIDCQRLLLFEQPEAQIEYTKALDNSYNHIPHQTSLLIKKAGMRSYYLHAHHHI